MLCASFGFISFRYCVDASRTNLKTTIQRKVPITTGDLIVLTAAAAQWAILNPDPVEDEHDNGNLPTYSIAHSLTYSLTHSLTD